LLVLLGLGLLGFLGLRLLQRLRPAAELDAFHALPAGDGGFLDVEALQKLVGEQIPGLSKPSKAKAGEPDEAPTPSTTWESEGAWSRASTLFSRWTTEELPTTQWVRLKTDPLNAPSSTPYTRQGSEPAQRQP